jgi:uncharacterized OsmC-like protein
MLNETEKKKGERERERERERRRKENNILKKKRCPISSSIKKSQKIKVNLFNRIIKHKS